MSTTVIAQGQAQNRLKELADGFALAAVASLPWSTSATGILIVLWFIALIPTLQRDDVAIMMTPAASLPVVLVFIAALGMLWADVAWAERGRGLSGFVKLLALPLLFIQFRRSANPHWVLIGFLASCVLLLLISTGSFLWPNFVLWSWAKVPGIPVKDYLIQAALFIVSAFILLALARDAFAARRHAAAAAYAALAVAFIANISFVATSRTALVTVPILLALFAVRYFGWKGACVTAAAGIVVAGLAWASSDYLRFRLGTLDDEVRLYQTEDKRTSAGERLEFWKKSVGFVTEAPVFGHGTGATRSLFARVASGGDGVSSLISTNPHNQFLAVAVQLGLFGGIFLIAMWIAHILLFRGEGLAAWIGLVIVTQNIFGSLFNSHLSDFGQGWLYVLGAGVAGGVVLARGDTKHPVSAPAQAVARA